MLRNLFSHNDTQLILNSGHSNKIAQFKSSFTLVPNNFIFLQSGVYSKPSGNIRVYSDVIIQQINLLQIILTIFYKHLETRNLLKPNNSFSQ